MFIFVLILFGLGFLCFFCPRIKCALFHPFKVFRNGVVDIYKYFRYRRYNICPTGNTRAYCGEFGKGKTLSATHDIVTMYKRYNNKRFYDDKRKKWITQKIIVLSNVEFKSIPYREFVSLDQIVNWSRPIRKEFDENNSMRTVLFALIDECSVQLNSRNFATNIDAQFLDSLMTCRHNNIGAIYYTAPRFKHIDAMLRQVTKELYACDKLWRLQKILVYDAQSIEESNDLTLVAPTYRKCWFVTNKAYNSYDTLATVNGFIDTYDNKDFMSAIEILAKQGVTVPVDPDTISHPSRKLKHIRKKIG